MSRLFTLIAIFAMVSPCLGQEHFECGTIGELAEGIVPRLLANKERVKRGIPEFRSTVYVPVKFHLIAKEDGSDRIPMSFVLDQLCELNDDFSDMDIQFFLHNGINFINNTAAYNNHFATTTLLEFNKDRQALNVFILKEIDSSDPGKRGYYSYDRDWIVLENQEVGRNRSLTHELGHFLSLLHPFHGWDIDRYDPDKHGVPAPMFSPMGVLTERQDGSNCETAGDKLCDTPADYAFQYPWPNCDFNVEILDPSSQKINPDEKLFMNYFNCPNQDYYFTEEQKAIMKADLLSNNRNYLMQVAPSSTSTIPSKPITITPTGGKTVEQGDRADFFWTEVVGATHYLVEVDKAPNFSSENLISQVSENPFTTVEGLDPDRLYFWRVKAFNDYFGCANFTSFATFKTGLTVSTTSSIPEVESAKVYPNPLIDDRLNLLITSRAVFRAEIRLLNQQGQAIQSFLPVDINAGKHQIPLSLEGQLAPGMYFLEVLGSSGGKLLEKIAIID